MPNFPVKVVTVTGVEIEGLVEVLANDVTDPLTHQLDSPLVSSLSVWDQFLTAKLNERQFSLNTYNFDTMADVLIPRAVGYSAGMLDFFFRGSLELNFEPDVNQASQTVLRAINRSGPATQPNALGAGGTLTLYADNADGDRLAIAAVTLSTSVPGNGNLPGISLDPLAEVSSLVAVYSGPLGAELDAVIPKIHPAAEVEQLFSSGGDWRLRTADGVFPLGIGSGPAVVKWGDADNMIVAQTFVSGSNDRIFTPYRIKRPVGSRVVPLVNGVVALEALGAPVRLGGSDSIDLGTTVKFKRKVIYSQQLVVLDVDSSNGGDRGFVVGSSSQIFDDYPPVVLDRTFALQMPITLPNPPQYLWTVLDFYLDRNGHVLVSVLAQLLGTTVQMPVRRFSDVTKELEDTTAVTFTVNLNTPTTRDIIFLVDVTTRSVVRDPNDRPIKSSEDTIDITYETIQQEAFVQFRDLAGNSYLPNAPHTDGTTAINPDPVAVLNIRHEIPAPPIMTGLFRPELASEGFGIPAVTVPQPTIQMTNLTGVSSFQSISTANVFSGAMGFQDMRRASASDNSFALIGSATPPGDTSGAHLWRPMFWSRATQSVTLLPEFESPVFSGASIADTSRATMMIFVNRFAAPRFTHTHFSSAVGDLLVTSDLRTQYDLLEPNLLFNVTDRAFHRIIEDLPALPAPRPLVTGTNIPTAGQYHVNGR